MKKILSLSLAVIMLVSAIPMVYAADHDVSNGTTITLVGSEEAAGESYSITVPAELQPGQSGTVTASGTWSSKQTLKVTAPNSVTLAYGSQTMDVGITFAGISQVGNDTAESSATAPVAVADASVLFGTWVGHLTYDVEMVEEEAVVPGATFSDGVTLSWEELKLEENGTKYGYRASNISDTAIGMQAFNSSTVTSITIPNGITLIDYHAFTDSSLTSVYIPTSVTNIDGSFYNCLNLTTIQFAGTISQWDAIEKSEDWKENAPATEVICSNGTVPLS